MEKKIEDIVAYVQQMLANGAQPYYYDKFARITARPGKVGEVITTVLANGHTETTNTVKNEGDMIVTNPGGEKYIVAKDVFAKKYEIDPKNPKQYKPKGGPQQMLTLQEDISCVAPWGELQHMHKGDKLNVTGIKEKDVYGIALKEFNDTYKQCDKDGNFLVQNLMNTRGGR